MPARGPTSKLESGEVREAARSITCLGLAFHILSYYEEDTNLNARVKPLCGGKPRIILYSSRCIDDTLDALASTLSRILGAPLIDYTVECREDFSEYAIGFDELTSRIVGLFRSSFYKPLAELSMTSREYFLVVGWNSEIAYGPGKEYEVSLPLIPAVIFAHTHPSPSCYPSSRDVASIADFLAQGGLAEFVVSRSCMSVARLVKPFSEDDYWRLKEVSDCIKNAEHDEDYLECLNRVARLDTVVFEIV